MSRIVLAFIVVCSTAITARSQTSPRIAWEKFTFAAASGTRVEAEKGWLEVPERHARPDGPRIRLAVVRLSSTAAKPGVPIIWLAGGPGLSGTRTATRGLYPMFEALRAHGDVIAFDQRGTGSSEPSLSVPGRFGFPLDKSLESQEAARRLVTLAETIRESTRSRGIDLPAYNTVENADDVDTLRQALGADRIAIWAHSYGTHLALAVIKRHGAHIERAILGGVNGLDHRWREPADTDQLLVRVARKIREDPELSKLTPDFLAQVKRVLQTLDREPILVPLNNASVLIGKAEIQTLVGLRSGEIEFIRTLPLMFSHLEKRMRLEEIAAAVQQSIKDRPIGTAMTYAMHVASGVSPQRAAKVAAQTPKAVLGNGINWGIGDSAFIKALGVPDLGEDFRRPFKSDVPVLLISATLDGRTSEADTREVGRQFRRASYITLDGASHDFWLASPRLLDLMQAFLRNESVQDERITVPVQFGRPE